MIKVVGLGPGAKEALTLGTIDALRGLGKVYLRTQKHPTVDYLKEVGIQFETFDYLYDSRDNFDDVYSSIAEELVERHKEAGDIIYAVPGHPLVAEKSVSLLMKRCESENIALEIVPAVSFIDAMMESLKIDAIDGIKIVDAFDIKDQMFDKRVGNIITQVYNKLIASEVKLALFSYYPEDTEIYFVRAAGVKNEESIRKIFLYELDRQEDIDYLTSIYIPRNLEATKDFNDLLSIMKTLRSEDGCPWDKEQTHESIKRSLIEECYEVLEAIDAKDDDMLVEELGDVLFNIVFHAEIGSEEGYFNINDVIKGICSKMIDRHPHIFGNVNVKNSEEVLVNWDAIKKEEKGFESYTDELRHIAKNLPALIRAEKVQAKAKKVGFDWDKVEDALNKVLEEFYEVKSVYNCNNRARIVDEVGDLLFSTVNVARFLSIDPEEALTGSTEKFIKRFHYMENIAGEKGMNLKNMTLNEMDLLWESAKNEEKR